MTAYAAPSITASPLAQLGERFRVVRELGRGGMGIVLLVEDRLRGQHVALKRVQHEAALDMRRLKHEYRAIESVAHPNVVSLYELGVDEQGPYFLMEAVEGVHLRAWCSASDGELPNSGEISRRTAGGAPTQATVTLRLTETAELASATLNSNAPSLSSTHSFARLYEAVPQLLAALACLHEQGLIHRDLKPGNVLVRRDGTIKLLDFGILGEAGAVSGGAVTGSAAYMAPEQIAGAPPHAASDLYSLGVMLFEIVTGTLPFPGASIQEVLQRHLQTEAPDAAKLAPECPSWLNALIAWLLRKQPEARPALHEVAQIWARETGQSALQLSAASGAAVTELVERGDDQRLLLDVLDDAAGAFSFVAICGDSGLGKSALLDWTRRAASRRQLAALRSRARFSERVPFNAFDGLVDELAALLERFPELTEDAEGLALRARAGAAFPVLRPRGAPRAELEPRDAFDALLALLQRCAKLAGGLVLFCDDLQWADADSVTLLQRMLDYRPEHVLLIATVRSDTHTEAFSQLWSSTKPARRIDLKRLSDGALAGIISSVAAQAGRSITGAEAELSVADCDGRPLLAMAFGRVVARTEAAAARQPISWLVAEYAARGRDERQLLSLLAVLDGKAVLPQLARLTSLPLGALDSAFAPLLREGLMLTAETFGESRSYDFSHDLIRRHVLEWLEAAEVQTAHGAIADDLESHGAPRTAWVRHLLGAKRYSCAAEIAAISGKEAEASTAYGLAADLYQVAIEHGTADTLRLRAARATALERLGRYLEAARQWSGIAEVSTGEARADAYLHQAKALLATKHLSEGKQAMELARRERNQRASLKERFDDASAPARFLLGPWALPGPGRIVKTVPSTISDERDVFLAAVLSFFDPVAGIRYMLRCRKAYREVGNRVQAAEADYVLAYIALWAASKQHSSWLGESYAKSARDALGGVTLPEHGRPYSMECQTQGTLALRRGDWARAAAEFDHSIAICEALGRKGSFEHILSWIHRQSADRNSQNIPQWERTLDIVERLTDQSPDIILRYEVAFGRTGAALNRGDFEESLRIARQARHEWQTEERSYQALVLDLFVLTPDVYLTDGLEGRRQLHRLWKTYAHFRPTSGMYRGFMLSMLAWFEAAALRKNVAGASYRKVLHWASEAEKSCPLGRHMAIRSAAYASDAVGKPERALATLRHAEQLALGVNQPIDVAIARYQLGLRLGGAEGSALQRDAETLLATTGAHRNIMFEDPALR